MGNNIRPRKATFTVKLVKGQRQFTAVNRRAHIVAKKAGKRSKLTLSDLRALSGTGTYRYYAYGESGTLKPIRL